MEMPGLYFDHYCCDVRLTEQLVSSLETTEIFVFKWKLYQLWWCKLACNKYLCIQALSSFPLREPRNDVMQQEYWRLFRKYPSDLH